MAKCAATGSVSVSYNISEPLLLDNQAFAANPSVPGSFAFVSGVSSVASGVDNHIEFANIVQKVVFRVIWIVRVVNNL